MDARKGNEERRYIYQSKWEGGSRVRIAAKGVLEEFMRTWKYHHPLQPSQLEFGGQAAVVAKVAFYHGGDVLYELVGVPGIWHERCLTEDDRAA